MDLVAAVVAALGREFAQASSNSQPRSLADCRNLQFEMPSAELYDRIGKVRKALVASNEVQALLSKLLVQLGFDPAEQAIDPARLRAVAHKGHENPLAAPAYTAHRDTWYANPQAQINWWIPLHDVSEGETFAFLPAYFDKAVNNNSADFDYDRWIAQVGWQNTTGASAVYPAADPGFDRASALPFTCQAGEILLFAASHLHQTSQIISGKTRFSMDFRTVHLDDHNSGLGAPNVDNLSTGCSLADYRRQ